MNTGFPAYTISEPPALSTDNDLKQAQSAPQNPLPSPASDPGLPETPTGADGQGLLAMFMGRPKEGVSKSEAGSKRAHQQSHEEADNSSEVSRRRSTTAAKIAGWNNSGVKRKRVSRVTTEVKTESTSEHGETENTSGNIATESEEHDLISHYTNSFLQHMQA